MFKPHLKPVWGERRRYDLSDLRWHKITEGKYYIRLHSSPVRGQIIQLYKGKVSTDGSPLNPKNNITEFAFAELTGMPVIFDNAIELHGVTREPAEAQRYVEIRRARAYTGRGR
jgi:hypothetical protein